LLNVFICYGGRHGQKIGVDLRKFLRNEGLSAFLASPRSPDVPSGIDFKPFIKGKLLASHVMVAICDSGIHASEPALEELGIALNATNPIPIVAFTEKGCHLPDLIRGKWEPIRFDASNPRTAYNRLLMEIYRVIDYRREQSEDLQNPQPMIFPLSRALRKLLRRR